MIKQQGGKSAIASVLHELAGAPAVICEPFGGGLAVSLSLGAAVIVAEKIRPIRALVCERIVAPGPQLALFGQAQTAQQVLERRGFDLVHTWAADEAMRRPAGGGSAVRLEGVWRRVRR